MTEPGRPNPPIGGHRLLSNQRSLALVTTCAEVDWWCAPDLDSSPLLWSLLDPRGPAARWMGASEVSAGSRPAGPSAEGVVVVDGLRIAWRDGLVEVDGTACLVRLVRSHGGDAVLRHRMAAGGFAGPRGVPRPDGFRLGGAALTVVSTGSSTVDGESLETAVAVDARTWSGLVVAFGTVDVDVSRAVELLDEAERATRRRLRRARLPRHHPERAAGALAVLDACTYRATGAVAASATTSLPEAPGADRQFDYRYCWLRDAALATSVASLLGQRDIAHRYLAFACRVAGGDPSLRVPVVDVRGDSVPEERVVDDVEGWAGSRPVRVGNAAAGQLQYDAWGLVVEAVSVHLQTGGSLDAATWDLVRSLADRMAGDEVEPSSGIWELRRPRHLVSGDIGRWLVLDRAIWIARGWRPLARRRRWKQARAEVRERVLAALGDDGRLPQAYDGERTPDASALMVPLFGLLPRRDPRSAQLVAATLEDLGSGPFVHRYRPEVDDEFSGIEGAFLPMSWWAVAALAVVGQVDEAEVRADELCSRLPELMSEEMDPEDGTSLGNVPLVWSHMEMARALYLLDAARIRRRYGAAGLTAWRIGRYAALRWGRREGAGVRRHGAGGTSRDGREMNEVEEDGMVTSGAERGGGLRARPAGPPAGAIRAPSRGIGRRSSAEAEAVSDALRRGADPFLARRRRTAAFSLVSMAGLGVVAAYQNGLIRHLPEPHLRVLDADRVDASGEAYQLLKTPDAALGIASAAVTLALVGMGGADRSRRQRWIPIALAAKALVDAGFSLFLTAEQATKHRRLCSWCLVTALANVAAAPQTWPEAHAAWRSRR